MSEDYLLHLVTFLAGVLATIAMVGSLPYFHDRTRAEAIERGYALHCPTNGQWAWIGECEE